jgi:hypothetical protein
MLLQHQAGAPAAPPSMSSCGRLVAQTLCPPCAAHHHAALVSGTIGVLGWTVAVPGRLWSLRTWSRDDWSSWWAGVKKTVKDEAHHYWVRGGVAVTASWLRAHSRQQGGQSRQPPAWHCPPDPPAPCIPRTQVGFKLLAFDVRVASGLAFKAMRGNQLTRCAALVPARARACGCCWRRRHAITRTGRPPSPTATRGHTRTTPRAQA